MKEKKRQSSKKSFTMIEVVISLGIVVTVLGALIGLVAMSLRSYVSAGLRLQAINLARDGMEQLRQVRDSSRLGKTGTFFDNPGDGCLYLDSASIPPRALSASSCGPSGGVGGNALVQVFTTTDTGFVDGGAPVTLAGDLEINKFGRQIRFTNVSGSSNNFYRVSSYVYWKENGQLKNISFENYIAKW